MDQTQVNKLIEALELRLKQLIGEADFGYTCHSGHHTRDIMTTLAVLKGKPEAEKLLANMPQKKDKPHI